MTLEADVARMIEDKMRQEGIGFKEALNAAARAGLREQNRNAALPFRQATYSMGHSAEFRWDKALVMADAIEDEEIVRKLMLRK